MKKISNETLFTIAEGVCIVSGLISYFCGNTSLGCEMMFMGFTNMCIALYYHDTEKEMA